jgi:hypothetical protein
MAEARIVAQANRSPTSCVACGTHQGPFLDFDLTIFNMATSSGGVDVDGALYLCVGSRETPGCLIQWARKSELMIDVGFYEDALLEIERLSALVEELKVIGKKRTLTLADAEKLLEPAV